MKTYGRSLALVPLFALMGCASESSESLKTGADAASLQLRTDTSAEAPMPVSWVDEAILLFIAKTSSPLIADARRRGQDLSWITDRTEPTDSATFTVVQIGHDMTEPDGSNPRFATDGWVYLDTTRRRIYEYDVATDSLMLWQE